ncbi:MULTISPECIES: flagellin [unclassified Sinorhizobium]|uniref:flagellin N-terminal helical domain-containing protein n=1 Tax=unclassified Sinorhizobium TaxID=2613772 RepID=UPI003525C240
MTSILTNSSAMAALQTLRQVNSSLQNTQNNVSSGLKVGKASDNAAYWSIATTMRSDNSALSAVSDALGMGAAKVDTAYTAMDSAIDVVTEIKAKLVAATEDGVDKSKVQDEISQLQDQLVSISQSASFNGENWLQAALGSSTASVEKSVVGSFVRDASGNVSVKSMNYNLDSSTVLFDTSTGTTKYGILDSNYSISIADQTTAAVSISYLATDGVTQKTSTATVATATGTWLVAEGYTVNTDTKLADDGGGNTWVMLSDDVWAKATNTPGDIDADGTADQQEVVSGWYVDTANTATAAGATTATSIDLNFSVSTLDISKLDDVASKGGLSTDKALSVMIQYVDTQLKSMTSAASALGSVSSRIGMQDDFVNALTDSIDSGVGRLVDADMEEESSKLSALQTQQQLAIQSLSIANSSSQNILSLFR